MIFLKYIQILLYLQIYVTKCRSTVDIGLPQLSYLSNHLTIKQCRLLFASLHFMSYESPATLSAAAKLVPKDVSCIKLLIKWNVGTEKWEGRDKPHVDIEHKLQYIGRQDLANWLGKEVFHRLAVDVNYSLNNYFVDDSIDKAFIKKLYEETEAINDDWTIFDSILWAILMGLLGTLALTGCRIIIMSYKNTVTRKAKNGEEIEDVLSCHHRPSVEFH